MSDEKIRILKMLEEGKVTAVEAEKLLSAVADIYVEDEQETPVGKAKWIKIRVFEGDSPKAKVKVSIPIKLAKIALKMGKHVSGFIPEYAKQKMENKGVDPKMFDDLDKFNVLLDGLADEGPFKIVDVEDGEKGEKVQITIE